MELSLAGTAAIACGVALAAGFLSYNYAIVRVPVATAGVVHNTLPIFGVVFAVAFICELLAPTRRIHIEVARLPDSPASSLRSERS